MTGTCRDRLTRNVLAGMAIALTVSFPVAGSATAQNSFPLADLVPHPRGGALGGQVFSGDLLAAGIDPTVADGEYSGLELAGGSHVLDLSWASVGGRFTIGDRSLVIVLSTLSYGSQYRTGMDDRLGLFQGTFSPTDLNLSASTLLLSEGGTTIGAGLTLLYGQLDDVKAVGLSAAVGVRQEIGPLELRGGLSNLGTAISAYGEPSGTKIPLRVRAGAALPLAGDRWEASTELLYRAGDRNVGWSGGLEWLPVENAALRLGFVQGDGGTAFSDDALSDAGLTAGLAWQFSDWRITYAWRSGGLFGSGHLLSLGWKLGPLR